MIVVGLVLGINIYLMNANKIVGNQMPMPLGFGIANVLSGSMEPTFSKGSLLIVKEGKEIKLGDIVVYQSNSNLIVHRVIEINDDQITTKGDANNANDEPFNKEMIKGIVVCSIPYLGSFLHWLRTPIGMTLFIVILFLMINTLTKQQKQEDQQQLEQIKQEIQRLKENLKESEDNEKRD